MSSEPAPRPEPVEITVDVVICAYTEARWHQLCEAVRSVGKQSSPAQRTLLVIDHNDELANRCKAEFGSDGVEVVANRHERGLSGARNTGVEESTAEVVAFLDDDARAEQDWLLHIRDALSSDGVVGVGGRVEPDWADSRPPWFPTEFDWVVGCSYRGLPAERAAIRNPIGASMAFTVDSMALGGGFDTGLGRVGTRPVGCEETELSIRIRRSYGPESIVYVPESVVRHSVSGDRSTVSYFVRRCWSEGRSKASVALRTGAQEALDSERRYVRSILTTGVLNGLRDPLVGWLRAGMIVVGLGVTGLGYLTGRARSERNVAGSS